MIALIPFLLGGAPAGEKQVEPVKLPPYPSIAIKKNVMEDYPKKDPQLDIWEVQEKIDEIQAEKEKQRIAEFKKLQKQRQKQLDEQRRAEIRQEQTRREQIRRAKTVQPSRGGGSNVDQLVNRLEKLGTSNARFFVNLAIQSVEKYNIEPLWILAMMKTESNFNSKVVSNHEAIGIMQMLPSTARHFGVSSSELYNPEINVRTCTEYLAYLLKEFGSLRMATIAYNQGEGNVHSGSYRTWYYDKVLSNYNLLKR